jgi:zinc transport system ATP-binding protein
MIRVDDLTVRLGDRDVLQHLSFTADRGDYVAILGPNGGGKSTLLKTILGLYSPSSGRIQISDAASHEEGVHIGYVPQIKSLDRTFPARAVELVVTAIRNRWPAVITRAERRVALAAMERVGAEALADRSVSSLSGGELQRIYLARAVIREPDLLLLDEPESGIDVTGTKDLYTLLETFHRATRTCILMVTHDWDVATYHASHVLLVNVRAFAFGPAHEALNEEAIRNTFGHVGHEHAMLAGADHPDAGKAAGGHRHV